MERTRVQYGEEAITLLYEAAIGGCTTTIETLIQKDELILDKVSLASFTETPLHISALLGHLDFTIAILEKCPTMALEQDSLKRLPVHLAIGKGHTQIVKALLNIEKRSCLARDGEGRTPLHLAVIRGKVEVIEELIVANSELILEDLDGDTVFHLCVKYNRLDVLRTLMELINDYKIINRGNQDGNSILHLAVMLKQLETLRYLLSFPEIITKVNSVNGKGFTPLELLDECPKDFKTLLIKGSLLPEKKWYERFARLMTYEVSEIREALMVAASLIATVTFQAVISPPGGVWQQDFRDGEQAEACKDRPCKAGTSVLASTNRNVYHLYIFFNSVAFFLSVIIIALMVCGFRLNHRVLVWLSGIFICLTAISLSSTYMIGMVVVAPGQDYEATVLNNFGIYFSAMFLLAVFFLVLLGHLVVKMIVQVSNIGSEIGDKLVSYNYRNEAAQGLA